MVILVNTRSTFQFLLFYGPLCSAIFGSKMKSSRDVTYMKSTLLFAYNMMKSSNDFGFVLGGSIWPFANPLDLVDLPVWKSLFFLSSIGRFVDFRGVRRYDFSSQ